MSASMNGLKILLCCQRCYFDISASLVRVEKRPDDLKDILSKIRNEKTSLVRMNSCLADLKLISFI